MFLEPFALHELRQCSFNFESNIKKFIYMSRKLLNKKNMLET